MAIAPTFYTPTYPNPIFQNFRLATTYSPIPMKRSFQDKLEQGTKQAFQEAKMHGLATFLMGSGTLVLNLIPRLKMPWKTAFLMTPVHMAWMVLISLGIGFVHGFRGMQRQHTVN